MSLRFTGSSGCRVNLGTLDVPSGISGLSICTWFNPDTFTIDGQRIISKGTGTSESQIWWGLDILNDSGYKKMRARLKTGILNLTTTLLANNSSTYLVANQKMFVVFLYDGSNMKLYLNNIESGSVAKTGNISTSSIVSAYIGDTPGAARNFDGVIDDVRIYTRALSVNEMTTIYYSESKDDIVYGLFSRWLMNESSISAVASEINSIIDVSDSKKHGTPAGSPTYDVPLASF